MGKLLCCVLLALPLHRLSVTSVFGFRVHPVTGKFCFHDGIDLRAKHDTVFSITNGVVNYINYDSFSGTYIKIEYGRLAASYCHLSQIFVLPGDSVNAGQPIAITGSTGRTTGEHLHLTMRYDGTLIDPLLFLLNTSKYFNQYRKENTK